MIKKFLVAIWLLLPFEAEAKLLDLSYFKLDNGLGVAVIENHKAPVVLQMLYYKTGSVNDPDGKGGLAHLLEHMMFRGTKNVQDQVFNRLTDENGAENNAYTTYNETGYYEFSDISKLELMMALEADRMTGLNLSEEAFVKERDIVLQERLQRFETKPTPLFYEMLNEMLWQEHPLSHPVSGKVNEIRGLQRDDAKVFYQKWYRPDNALLVLSGDISVDEAKVLAEKYYGAIKNEEMTIEPQEYAKPKEMDGILRVKLKGVEQPRFAMYVLLEGGTFSKQEILALELLAHYLAADDAAYLYDQLVYQDKKLLSVDMGVSYDEKLGGTLGFYAIPVEMNVFNGDMSKLLLTTVKNGLAELTEEKLKKIKNQMLSNTVYMQENPESAARFAGAMLMNGYSAQEIMLYDEAILKVSVEDVLKVWQKVMASKTRVSGYLEAEKADE